MKTDRFLSTAIFALALTFTATAAFAQEKGTFTDTRDKKTYKTVKIGEQTWLAENLNYNASGSKCYDNKPANCDKYGRLYNWNTAKKACPVGWHLPTLKEWQTITSEDFDTFGFATLNGGGYLQNGGDGPGGNNYSFSGIDAWGYWWSSSEMQSTNAFVWMMLFDYGNLSKVSLVSVRCVQD